MRGKVHAMLWSPIVGRSEDERMTAPAATHKKEDPSWEEATAKEVYAWLTSYYLHQDQLSWSRTQTTVAVEAGVLAAVWSIDGRASTLPLLVGTLIVFLLWGLIQRDWEIRDQDIANLDTVHRRFGIALAKTPRYAWRRGSFVINLLTLLLSIVNLVLAGTYLFLGSDRVLGW